MNLAGEHVDVHYAKTHLSRLLERVERGEEIIVCRGGAPFAKFVPLSPDELARRGEGQQ